MADGRCLCGAVTFRVIGEPLWVAHCHCESCRRQTGSIAATYVGYKARQVHYGDTPPEEFESSSGIFRGFCPTCGSAIHYRPAAQGEIHHFLGVYNHPARYRASRHVFYRERIAGYELADNLPRFEHLSGTPVAWGERPTRNVLFVCEGHSARSILAEALTNRLAKNGIRAFSASSSPVNALPPNVVEWLTRSGFDAGAYRSKSWMEFLDGPDLQWVITLSDTVSGQLGIAFKGPARRAHWHIDDPDQDNLPFETMAGDLADAIRSFVDDSEH